MRSPFSVLTIRLSSWIACERPQRHLSEHLHEPVPRLLFGAHLYFCPKFAFRVENLEVRQGGGQRLGRSSSLHPRVLKKFRCVQPPRSARDPTTARPGNGREPAVGLADAVRFSNLFTSAVASELTCFHCLSGKSTCVCTPCQRKQGGEEPASSPWSSSLGAESAMHFRPKTEHSRTAECT